MNKATDSVYDLIVELYSALPYPTDYLEEYEFNALTSEEKRALVMRLYSLIDELRPPQKRGCPNLGVEYRCLVLSFLLK